MTGDTFKLVSASRLDGRDQPWRLIDKPLLEINPIGSMIIEDESRFLYWLAANYFTGSGKIVDMGPLAGGSTHALACGLMNNASVQSNAELIHSYDMWLFYEDWKQFFPGQSLKDHDDILPCFIANIRKFRSQVVPHKGDISLVGWSDGPIEILFIDAAKTPHVMEHIVDEFYPALIPGRSLVIQQDFVSAECPWIHAIQEYLSDYFEVVDSPQGGTVCFRLLRAIPRHVLDKDFYSSLDKAEGSRLISRAADRLRGWFRLCVVLSQAHYLALAGDPVAARRILDAVGQDKDYNPAVEFDLKLVHESLASAGA